MAASEGFQGRPLVTIEQSLWQVAIEFREADFQIPERSRSYGYLNRIRFSHYDAEGPFTKVEVRVALL
jgi:hypothetical protein